jgi:hypothetical protein
MLNRCLALAVVPTLVASASPAAHAAPVARPAAAAARTVIGPPMHQVSCGDVWNRRLPWDSHTANTFEDVWTYYEFGFIWSEPTFNISDTRIAVNNLDTPASATFTSQKSKTWTITVKADAQKKFGELLQITVTTMYAWSQTTQVNVAVTAMVPPHSTVRGDYGVSAFNVTTWDHVVQWRRSHFRGAISDYCAEGSGQVTRNVPTRSEGWQLTAQ